MKIIFILLFIFQLTVSTEVEKIKDILKVSKFWDAVCPSVISFGHVKTENLNKNDISLALKAHSGLRKKFVLYKKKGNFEDYLYRKTPVTSNFGKILEKLSDEQVSENLCDARDFKILVPESFDTVTCNKVGFQTCFLFSLSFSVVFPLLPGISGHLLLEEQTFPRSGQDLSLHLRPRRPPSQCCFFSQKDSS